MNSTTIDKTRVFSSVIELIPSAGIYTNSRLQNIFIETNKYGWFDKWAVEWFFANRLNYLPNSAKISQ